MAAEKVQAAAAARRAITFQGVAEDYLAANCAGWRNPKHRAQWSSTPATYAYPTLGKLAVADVTTQHVLDALEPIWTTKPETRSNPGLGQSRLACRADQRAKLMGNQVADCIRASGHNGRVSRPDT